MNNSNNSGNSYRGPGFISFLTLLFIGLKLTGYITWTWVWVLSPIWISLSVWLGFVLIFLLVLLIVCGTSKN